MADSVIAMRSLDSRISVNTQHLHVGPGTSEFDQERCIKNKSVAPDEGNPYSQISWRLLCLLLMLMPPMTTAKSKRAIA